MARYSAVTFHAFNPDDVEIPDDALVVGVRRIMHDNPQGHGKIPALEIDCLIPRREQTGGPVTRERTDRPASKDTHL